MPAKSKAQYRLMEGIAHGTIPEKGTLTRRKAKEYVEGQSSGGLPERKGKKGRKGPKGYY